MTEEKFIPKPYSKAVEKGNFTWSSPSNIALVKYWGKKERQIPENPSISFTLNNCKTITKLTFSKKQNHSGFSFEVFLDDEKKDDFKPKIETFFNRVEQYLPFLKDFHFKIETSNTFPHSSGIASSASGMSALALCLMSVEKELVESDVTSSAVEMSDEFFIQKASFLARLGSGSACRSLEGDLVVWGKHDEITGSSDLFGVKYPFEVHENFKNYQDTILLVDKGEKQVSSTVGHNLMHGHPFAQQRFNQANQNLSNLISILKEGDLDAFIALVESEALTLHAMMMTSMPYFILMKPNTLEIINKIWTFRKNTGSKVCFTLDAGANVHVLFPEKEKDGVLKFIKNELVAYCQNGHYISDRIGFGSKLL
ncbi:diphosphomevalonate decarboxylase [Flaviramulus sp. BrNp1-15]|uniref:diphosphomevalonate/mevalonate 3,5-bisphosphate decarboxylase family protein n=1 Tax=Flaviramulus sp. BrNp1-15 TaxID=2916754 RepID=UPI001EE7B965|nr:diphosphomevalonate decarboxylase [Flaviramulus sp. BrNp1-15]ULC60124.1 diphosphomevalonate decarboxylase [Flaviramulus sp. BrNp1-15]